MRLFGKGARRSAATRLFFATDLHSSEICFRKLLAAPRAYDVSDVIMGGDCTGKMLIPLVEQEDVPGVFHCDWSGETSVIRTAEEVAELEKRIRNSGQYPVRLKQTDADALETDGSQLGQLFSQRMCETLAGWVALAEERLGGNGVHVIMTPGNDDEFEVDEVLRASSFVDAAEGRIGRIGAHELLSIGWSNHTPWDTPRECSEEELAAKIDALAEQVEDMPNAIFNIHVPPYGTGLDDAPELDENLKPIRSGSIMKPVGSVAVRDAILRHQPLVSLHGHIHESRAVQRLGRTVCINPGSIYGEWILQGVVLELDARADGDTKVGYTLTEG